MPIFNHKSNDHIFSVPRFDSIFKISIAFINFVIYLRRFLCRMCFCEVIANNKFMHTIKACEMPCIYSTNSSIAGSINKNKPKPNEKNKSVIFYFVYIGHCIVRAKCGECSVLTFMTQLTVGTQPYQTVLQSAQISMSY